MTHPTALSIALLLGGCVVTEVDENRSICVGDPLFDDEVEILEDEPLTAGFTSSSCGQVMEAFCNLEVNGWFILATTFEAREHSLFSEDCTLMERSQDVTCSTEPLAAGTWTLVFDHQEADLEVPSIIEPFCLGLPEE